MNPVTQEDELGCGVACVSFITQKSYAVIKSSLEKQKVCNNGFLCKELVNALFQFGFSYSYKYIKPHLKRKIYNNGTIVFIKRSKRYPFGHYLVRFEGKWMDP